MTSWLDANICFVHLKIFIFYAILKLIFILHISSAEFMHVGHGELHRRETIVVGQFERKNDYIQNFFEDSEVLIIVKCC